MSAQSFAVLALVPDGPATEFSLVKAPDPASALVAVSHKYAQAGQDSVQLVAVFTKGELESVLSKMG